MTPNEFIETIRAVAYGDPPRKDWLALYEVFPHDRALSPAEAEYFFGAGTPEPQWITAKKEIYFPSQLTERHLLHTYRFVYRCFAPNWSVTTARLRRWWLLWFSREILRRNRDGALSQQSKDLYVSVGQQSHCSTCRGSQMDGGVCLHCARISERKYDKTGTLWRLHAGYHYPQQCRDCHGPIDPRLWCRACKQFFTRGRWISSPRSPAH